MINLFSIVYIMQDDDIKVIIRIDFLFIIYSFVTYKNREGIFEIKTVNIINIIWNLKKKERRNENERTSNRRAYDYSYE